jgi:hypothetical protein
MPIPNFSNIRKKQFQVLLLKRFQVLRFIIETILSKLKIN